MDIISYAKIKKLFGLAEMKANKGEPNGYASLDETGNVPASQLENVPGGGGGMVEHGNEWHDPDFASQADFTAHLADNTQYHVQTATIVVAANTSKYKQFAHYVCDGVDDQVEIQAAINSLPASGGRVVLLDGVFNISNAISLPSNITFDGQGVATVLKKTVNSVGYALLKASGPSNSNIYVKNIKIDGNVNEGASVARYVSFKDCADSCIEKVIITNCYDSDRGALLLESVNHFTVKDCIMEGNLSDGIHIRLSDSYGSYVNLINNVVRNNEGSGISLIQHYYCFLLGNKVISNGLRGIIVAEASHSIISNNIIIGNGTAANNTYANLDVNSYISDAFIFGNLIRSDNISKYGISIGSINVSRIFVTSNDLYQSGVTGSFSDSGSGTITNPGNRL